MFFLIRRVFLIIVLLTTLAEWVYSQSQLNPAGYWLAKDPKNGQYSSVMEVWQEPNGSYSARVFQILDITVDGVRSDPKRLCSTCGGTKKNKPFLCMKVVWGLVPEKGNDNSWINGTAYDPQSDETYGAKIWLSPDGHQLNLRGFLGISLLGRTEVWKRTNKPNPSSWVCAVPTVSSW